MVEIANEHADAPASDSILAVQVKQPRMLAAPIVGLYLPMGQLRQYVEPVPVIDDEYVPAGQGVHTGDPTTLL